MSESRQVRVLSALCRSLSVRNKQQRATIDAQRMTIDMKSEQLAGLEEQLAKRDTAWVVKCGEIAEVAKVRGDTLLQLRQQMKKERKQMKKSVSGLQRSLAAAKTKVKKDNMFAARLNEKHWFRHYNLKRDLAQAEAKAEREVNQRLLVDRVFGVHAELMNSLVSVVKRTHGCLLERFAGEGDQVSIGGGETLVSMGKVLEVVEACIQSVHHLDRGAPKSEVSTVTDGLEVALGKLHELDVALKCAN